MRQWCPVHLKREDPAEWSACDDALYEQGYQGTPLGPVKAFGNYSKPLSELTNEEIGHALRSTHDNVVSDPETQELLIEAAERIEREAHRARSRMSLHPAIDIVFAVAMLVGLPIAIVLGKRANRR